MAGPRGIVGDGGQVFISDTYNNRVHIYNIPITNPAFQQFRGFDSLAKPHATAPATRLKTPLGIDVLNVTDSTVTPSGTTYNSYKHYAVADYGNNRLAIFPTWTTAVGGFVGREYGTLPYYPEFPLNKPTAVAYAWDKATGWQTNDLFVVCQGNGRLVTLHMDYPNFTGYPTVHFESGLRR